MLKFFITLGVLYFIIVKANSQVVGGVPFDSSVCKSLPQFTQHTKDQIKSFTKDVQKIIDYVVNGADSGKTYDELSIFVDKFGSRFAGTKNYEDSIDYMVDKLKKEHHDNVHTENLTLPNPWVRGQEWAKMIKPRIKPLAMSGVGGCVGTEKKVLTGQVMAVKTFEELKLRGKEAVGKFVLVNYDYHNYSDSAKYRGLSVSEASRYGGVAALIRSATPFSINSPHAGGQCELCDNCSEKFYFLFLLKDYEKDVKKIPATFLSVEDADLIERLARRGENVTVQLYMEAETHEPTITRNVISENLGTEFPEQAVLVSGHLDSWDVGQGAMDDGGGAFISWRAISILKKLGLKTKRTLRSILWAAEEYGLVGAQAYLNQHMNDLKHWSLAMESDLGTFTPTGLSYSGTNTTAQCIVNEVLQLLKPINATELIIGVDGSDVLLFNDKGVPISGLQNKNDKYFYFHHSEGDTMTVEDKHVLDLCLTFWTATSYVFASIDDILPR